MPFNKYSPNGLHLYHATKAPVIVFTAEDEATAKADGYSEQYQHQEFPKAVEHQEVGGASHITKLAHE